MKGKPKYKEGDIVSFKCGNATLKGEVYIVDKWGTWDDPSDASYDIMVQESKHTVSVGIIGSGEVRTEERTSPCLYKHISERFIV